MAQYKDDVRIARDLAEILTDLGEFRIIDQDNKWVPTSPGSVIEQIKTSRYIVRHPQNTAEPRQYFVHVFDGGLRKVDPFPNLKRGWLNKRLSHLPVAILGTYKPADFFGQDAFKFLTSEPVRFKAPTGRWLDLDLTEFSQGELIPRTITEAVYIEVKGATSTNILRWSEDTTSYHFVGSTEARELHYLATSEAAKIPSDLLGAMKAKQPNGKYVTYTVKAHPNPLSDLLYEVTDGEWTGRSGVSLADALIGLRNAQMFYKKQKAHVISDRILNLSVEKGAIEDEIFRLTSERNRLDAETKEFDLRYNTFSSSYLIGVDIVKNDPSPDWI